MYSNSIKKSAQRVVESILSEAGKGRSIEFPITIEWSGLFISDRGYDQSWIVPGSRYLLKMTDASGNLIAKVTQRSGSDPYSGPLGELFSKVDLSAYFDVDAFLENYSEDPKFSASALAPGTDYYGVTYGKAKVDKDGTLTVLERAQNPRKTTEWSVVADLDPKGEEYR